MLYTFEQWDQNLKHKTGSVEEGVSLQGILKWFSNTFGGDKNKIDLLISDLQEIEYKFAEEWNEIQVDIDELEVQKAQIKNDPAEIRKIERLIERNDRLLDALTKKKRTAISEIESKIEKITDKKPKLVSYWNLQKTKAEAEIAENLYQLAKKLSREEVAEELYSKYKEASLRAKKKDEEFKRKFGNLKMPSGLKTRVPKEDKETSKRTSVPAEISHKYTAEFEESMDFPPLEFDRYVKGLDKKVVQQLKKYLIEQRNEMYVLIDSREAKVSEMKKTMSAVEAKEIQARFIEFRKSTMEQIRQLRTKITICNRYD
jgi:hypothetical protein